jgi:hypothetical protein
MTPALRNIIMPGYCPEAIAFFQRTTALTSRRMRAYDKMIRALVASGVWAQLDAFWVFATKDTATALLNLKSSSFAVTITGSPTFTADAGYTGVDASATDYGDTNFNPTTAPSPKLTQNSNHLSVWTNTNGTSNVGCIGSIGISTNFGLIPKRTADNLSYFRAYDAAGGSSGGVTAPADPRGLHVGVRTGASAQAGYINGVDQGMTPVASAAPDNQTVGVFGRISAGTWSGSGTQVMTASLGGALTAAQVSAFYRAQRGYLQTIAGIIY